MAEGSESRSPLDEPSVLAKAERTTDGYRVSAYFRRGGFEVPIVQGRFVATVGEARELALEAAHSRGIAPDYVEFRELDSRRPRGARL